MVKAIPDILARIVARKRAELDQARPHRAELEKLAQSRRDFRDFRAALRANPPAVIAEIKQASPSKGFLTATFDPASIAREYAAGGAAALSVLTDRDFFHGSLADLQAARSAAPVPVLRKDFTINEFHVLEAAANGADAILLIAAILDQREMCRFRELAAELGMAALIEVHEEADLAAALASGAEIVGVNNRNLHTFEVTLDTSLRLLEKIPAGLVKVAESGIESREDVRRLAGYDAFLVGEHLMRSPDPAAALRALRS
ncbi:MAG TPA: indole-3-glycerol phosphate synthase TrpC [Bryobacteraceae bacterium]|jgi:indole-3-glycerol phosphate synthase|nr:indole-3-glycerol phosphate synthase TrpC [Bryobacteraceae bacterium]